MEKEEEKPKQQKETELQFPPTPYTVTVRRNPRRRARDTPSSNAPDHPAPKLPSSIKPFSLEEILQPELDPPQIPPSLPNPSSHQQASENLRVFLRIRPLNPKPKSKKKSPRNLRSKADSDKDKKKKKIAAKQTICLVVNDSHSVSLSLPASLSESKRSKTEVYDGFSHVFTEDSPQRDVYERVMEPLVSDFINGKSRLLAAMGPTGSGKTHTVFGCPREPGLVPLALRQIFYQSSGTDGDSRLPRSFYLSMFEICSERGKGERISDLSADLANFTSQQSSIRGVKEVMVTDVMQAECFVSCGLLKRATAATNANAQSSRSQCIINIRNASTLHNNAVGFLGNDAVLTIVDLAGAERERRTGIQGQRLLESNFINNTSMIFGLCLRSLLEHQKNPKKPLEKHFQNSLLTKYLRDYLEGKKRMTLILTAKPGEEDYHDTSFLLRLASPCMKIKFTGTDEVSNMPCQKRHIPLSNRTNQFKRRKCNDVRAFLGSIEVGQKCCKGVSQILGKSGEKIAEQVDELEPQKDFASPSLTKMELQNVQRKYQIMQTFSKALWNVLKQYKEKLEVSESAVQNLEESLRNEKARFLDLQKELNKLKSNCPCDVQCSTKASSNNEHLDLRAKGINAIGHDSEDLAELGVDDISPVLDMTGWKLSMLSVSLCEPQVLDQEGSSVVISSLDGTISSEKLETMKSPQLSILQVSPPKDDEGSIRCNIPDVPNGEKRQGSSSGQLNKEKPRRKLLPASAMLVKEIGAFDIDNDNPKNNKTGEKMATLGGRKQTPGSISLLRLLRTNR